METLFNVLRIYLFIGNIWSLFMILIYCVTKAEYSIKTLAHTLFFWTVDIYFVVDYYGRKRNDKTRS